MQISKSIHHNVEEITNFYKGNFAMVHISEIDVVRLHSHW